MDKKDCRWIRQQPAALWRQWIYIYSNEEDIHARERKIDGQSKIIDWRSNWYKEIQGKGILQMVWWNLKILLNISMKIDNQRHKTKTNWNVWKSPMSCRGNTCQLLCWWWWCIFIYLVPIYLSIDMFTYLYIFINLTYTFIYLIMELMIYTSIYTLNS